MKYFVISSSAPDAKSTEILRWVEQVKKQLWTSCPAPKKKVIRFIRIRKANNCGDYWYKPIFEQS